MAWLRHPRDAAPVAAALALGALCLTLVPWLYRQGPWGMSLGSCSIALVVWWTSNTVAHLHLHRPLLRPRGLSRLFSLYLSALTGVPQTIWRARHLAHHRGRPCGRVALGVQGSLEVAALAHLALALALAAPGLFFGTCLPGYLLGLGLCGLQGRGEHLGDQAGGISHEGRLYNRLWFNDGYHAEHHRWPGAHWSTLPARRLTDAPRSPTPPVLRGLGGGAAIVAALVALERLALRSPALQAWLVARHAAALRRLLPALGDRPVRRVLVVGGGLFPRTALALAEIWPEAQVTIVDADAAHLACAAAQLAARGRAARLVHGRHDPSAPADADLVVLPLALVGDRDAAYAAAGPPRLVHDWIWRRRGAAGAVVSPWLLKRINLADPDARR